MPSIGSNIKSIKAVRKNAVFFIIIYFSLSLEICVPIIMLQYTRCVVNKEQILYVLCEKACKIYECVHKFIYTSLLKGADDIWNIMYLRQAVI